MSRVQELAMLVDVSSFEELVPVIEALAKKVYAHRLANKGFVPLSVFEWLLGMSGVNTCSQIVYEVVGRVGRHVGFALRKRDPNDVGTEYADRFHNTCCTFRMTDTPEDAIARNTREAYANPADAPEPTFLGVTIHDEPERRSACVTMMYRRKITTEELAGFTGEWRVFKDEEILGHSDNIVDSNWYQLEWVMDPNRPMVGNVRGGHRRKEG